MKNEYEKQAEDFLEKCDATITVVPDKKPKKPLWNGEGKNACYIVTIKTPRGSYTFNFWDSIHNTEILEALEILKSGNVLRPALEQLVKSPGYWKSVRTIEKYLLEKTGEKVFLNSTLGASMKAKKLAENIEQFYPSQYSVLACLSGYYPETFEDFCNEFGYDTDSIKAKETFEAVQKEELGLRRIFTTDQLEKLAEIN